MKSTAVSSYYGPLPSEAISKAQLLPLRIGAILAGLFGRHLAGRAGLSKPGHSEIEILDECREKLRFTMWKPQHFPDGYRVVSANPSTTRGDAAVITLRALKDARTFEIAQQPGWLPIEEQLSTARLPFTRIHGTRSQIFVVHGRHGGEPIDHSFWITRQTVIFEYESLVIELRQVRGSGPGLGPLLHYASTVCGG